MKNNKKMKNRTLLMKKCHPLIVKKLDIRVIKLGMLDQNVQEI